MIEKIKKFIRDIVKFVGGIVGGCIALCIAIMFWGWVIFAINSWTGYKFFTPASIYEVEFDRAEDRVTMRGVDILGRMISSVRGGERSVLFEDISSSKHKAEGLLAVAPEGEYPCTYDHDTLRIMNSDNIIWYNLHFENGIPEGTKFDKECKVVLKGF